MDDQTKCGRFLQILIALGGIKSFTANELASRFEISNRSVMRDLATIRKEGFVVECNHGVYHIPKIEQPFKAINELLHFSEEEAFILSKAIHSIDDNNLLKNNLINKLYALYDFERVVETVVKPENIKTVHELVTAIKEKKQVLLRKYRSSHGRLVRDRLLEPFDFTTNYTYVWAFEPESQSCKLFKTSRIGEVQVLDKPFEHEIYHEKEPMDIFRISSKNQTQVILQLSLRAYNLLIEEYPLAEQFITSTDDNCWQLKAPVCGFEGVGRFCMGLLDEINIIEPEALRQYIKLKLKNIANKI